MTWGPIDLDARLPQDHVARVFWDLLDRLDLSKFYEWIKARGSSPGRPAIDPKILLSLWLLATSDGIASANEIERLCGLHDAYRWLCGGVNICDHVLSDFRTENAEEIDDLMTQVLAVLVKQGVLTLDEVAQDGMKVRASAGAASFRREETLEDCAEKARAHLEQLKRDATKPESQWSRRQASARERGARERQQRVEEALRQLPQVKEARLKAAKRRGGAQWKRVSAESAPTAPAASPAATPSDQSGLSPSVQSAPPATSTAGPRVSTTDPDARVMKMADGGFRPAYNVQVATDAATRVVVGVYVTNVGSDGGEIMPMLEKVRARVGKLPAAYLVDGGFVKLESIDRAEAQGTRIYAPVPQPNSPRVDPYAPKKTDGLGTAEWRQRMTTPEAKQIFKRRAATAETTNAELRVKLGLDRLLVRGLAKVGAAASLAALTYDLLRPIVHDALLGVASL